MENQIKVFENEQFGSVRTIVKDNEPWFVAADVCKALEIDSTATRRLDDDEKAVLRLTQTSSNGVEQGRDVSIVNEPGLYSLVLGSRKPEAKSFKRWITHEVVPSLRKTVSALETIEYKGNIDGLVYAKDGIATTTSVNIANVFERSHKDILEVIDNKLNRNLAAEFSAAKSDTTAEFVADHIKESIYIDSRGKAQRQYELDEYGFSFIALSLTGEKADTFKIKYINAFIEMRNALQNMFKACLIESVLPQDNRNRQYIYVLKNPLNETVKIGVAQDVEKRIQQLQTGAGVELELVYQSLVCSNAFSIERDVHAHFEDRRTFGEWFKVNPSDVVRFLEQQTFVLKSEFNKYIGIGSVIA